MKRIDADGHVGNMFTDGNPALGVPATVVDAEWLNAVQEELINVILAAGLTPDGANNAQLLAALGVVGGGGGGGGGANWQPTAGTGAIEDYGYSEKVWLFSQGASQSVTLWVKVPNSYSAGRQITMRLGQYSPSAINNYRLQTVTTLVKKNTDAITTSTNTRTSTNSDVLNTLANKYVEETYDLTAANGTINGVAVGAGDILKVELTRVAPAGAEDTADIRFIPSATEVKFT